MTKEMINECNHLIDGDFFMRNELSKSQSTIDYEESKYDMKYDVFEKTMIVIYNCLINGEYEIAKSMFDELVEYMKKSKEIDDSYGVAYNK